MTRQDKDRHIHAAIALCTILALAMIWNAAMAATGTAALNYIPPTTYVDGSALPASAITGYSVGCTFTPTGGTATACTLDTTTLPGTASSGTVKITYPAVGGQACFTLKTVTAAATSDGSQPPACKTLPAVKPSDPTNLTITVTLSFNLASDSPITVAMAEPVVSTKP